MIRFHTDEIIYSTNSTRAATVLADAAEHAVVRLRWHDTGAEERALPEAVQSMRAHERWLQEQKARAR